MLLGILTSALDEQAYLLILAVLNAIKAGILTNIEVTYIFCNHEIGEPKMPGKRKFDDQWLQKIIDLTEKLGIKIITFSSATFEPELWTSDRDAWREKYDQKVMPLLPQTDFDFLLGYMLIVSGIMCSIRPMLNLHPGRPGGPAGTYVEVIHDLIAEWALETGIRVHFVTRDLDGGPDVTYCIFTILSLEFNAIRAEGMKRETAMIILTIQLLTENLTLGKIPVDLSITIDAIVASQ